MVGIVKCLLEVRVVNWSDLGEKVADFAPLLGSALGPAGSVVGSLIASEFGTENTPDAISKSLINNTEAQVKLREIELRHKEKLESLVVETLALELKDKQSARLAHANSKMPGIICGVLTFLAAIYGAGLFFIEMPIDNKDMINYFGGQLITAWLASIHYWVGTTRSSSDKTRLMMK